MKNRVENFVGI